MSSSGFSILNACNALIYVIHIKVEQIMKVILILLLCMILSGMAFSQKAANKSTLKIDSLSFSYDVRSMTILMNDTPVHYSVVFNPETGMLRNKYIMIRGTLSRYEAIKLFGEKYRKGILFYRKKGENSCDK